MRAYGKIAAIVFLAGAMAACAPKPAPILVPKPLPPVIIPPPPPQPLKPLPPGGAASSTKLPSYGADGVRITPNRGLSRDEMIWHFRAALNVAALNCQGPIWGEIAQNYNKVLVLHKTRLNQSNLTVDNEYRKRFPGQNALRVRDTRMTDIYNYFALPPVRQEYCDTALRKSREAILVPSVEFPDFSIAGLSEMDGIFLRFYDAYAKYEIDVADWNLKYGPPPAPQPIMVPGTAPTTTPMPAMPGGPLPGATPAPTPAPIAPPVTPPVTPKPKP